MAKKQQEVVEREVLLTDATKLVISSFLNDDGEPFINLRKFYKKKSDDKWMPDRQGLVFRGKKGKKVIKAMIACYQNMEEEAVPLPPREEKKGKGKSKKSEDDDD